MRRSGIPANSPTRAAKCRIATEAARKADRVTHRDDAWIDDSLPCPDFQVAVFTPLSNSIRLPKVYQAVKIIERTPSM